MAYNILIIDDSSIVRRVLKKSLGLADIELGEVYEAENGQQGLDVLQENWIDLVFLDINMPVMNGMEFMRKVRSDNALSDTPIIIISTEGSKERKEELMSMDIKAYLRKPITPEQLTSTITELLDGASA